MKNKKTMVEIINKVLGKLWKPKKNFNNKQENRKYIYCRWKGEEIVKNW
jgi:hypothetical protein